MRRGTVSDLTWTDLDGNTYVAQALGKEENDEGKLFVCFSSIRKNRRDGSLENSTLLSGDSNPYQWKIMDEKGKRIMFISRKTDGSYTVTFYENDEDKFIKEWEVDPELNIYSEQVQGEDGHYHFTHNLP